VGFFLQYANLQKKEAGGCPGPKTAGERNGNPIGGTSQSLMDEIKFLSLPLL
jgi:hypothetical protein